jgi:hypothetical protein
VEACTPGQKAFQSNHPLRISIVESGSNYLVYAQNTGKNILFLRRIVLYRQFSGGSSMHFFRDDGPLAFEVGGSRLEPGLTQLKVKLSKGSSLNAQAQAEYHELTCRELSCAFEA